MRVINIDTLEWIQITCKEMADKAILILKPHINDLNWFDAEPVRHGRWLDEGCYNVCSLCAADFDKYDDGGYLQDFDYCPKCGAKMDLEEKNESN